MVINIRAMNIDLTDALRQYIEEKFNSLEKYESNIIQADVTIGRETHHHNKGPVFTCAANLDIPGDLMRIEKNEEDLYKAIDKVKDHLREALAQRKKY